MDALYTARLRRSVRIKQLMQLPDFFQNQATGCGDIAYCLVGYFILSHPVGHIHISVSWSQGQGHRSIKSVLFVVVCLFVGGLKGSVVYIMIFASALQTRRISSYDSSIGSDFCGHADKPGVIPISGLSLLYCQIETTYSIVYYPTS